MSLIQTNIKKDVVCSYGYKLARVDDKFSKLFKSYFRPILESKGMHTIFQKKGKQMFKKGKKGKIFESLSKNIQNLKIF